MGLRVRFSVLATVQRIGQRSAKSRTGKVDRVGQDKRS